MQHKKLRDELHKKAYEIHLKSNGQITTIEAHIKTSYAIFDSNEDRISVPFSKWNEAESHGIDGES